MSSVISDARTKQIIEILNNFDSQGVPFATSKQKLLAAGYSEDEITQAAYQVPYNAKPNTSKPIDPATQYYAQHDAETEKVGQAILKAQQKDRQDVARLDGLAASYAPDLQSGVYYQNKYLHDIGMSWWTWLLIEGALAVAIYIFNLPYVTYGVIIISLIFYLAKKYA